MCYFLLTFREQPHIYLYQNVLISLQTTSVKQNNMFEMYAVFPSNYRSESQRLAVDVEPFPHDCNMYILRLFFQSTGTKYDGKQKTLKPKEYTHRLQPNTDRVQCVDLLRGKHDNLNATLHEPTHLTFKITIFSI